MTFELRPRLPCSLPWKVRISSPPGSGRISIDPRKCRFVFGDAPNVFLGYQKHQVVTRANITDFQLQPTYIYYFAGVGKA
jgi:hypothetical protein